VSNKNIIIKARTGSNRFKRFAHGMMVVEETKDENGNKDSIAKGDYLGERFPNTGGFRRPMFDTRKGKWGLVLDNGEEATEEWLAPLVVRCKFRYEQGPKKGELITHADLYDIDDEFFNHRQLKNYLDEGFGLLDADNPLHAILAAGYRGHPETAKVGLKAYTSNQRLVISDANAEEETKSRSITRKVEAFELFAKMSIDRKRRVIQVLKNKEFVTPLSEETLNVELYTFIEDGERENWTGASKLDDFIEIAKMSHEDLTVKEMVVKATRVGIIKNQRGGLLFDSKKIANNIREAEYHFKQPDNLKDFEKLEKKLGLA
jgi:hypothetical protein